MKKVVLKLGIATVASLFMAQEAMATPAFARQVNMDCLSCHAQNIPKLNKFGREFKIGGFTMSSGQGAQTLMQGFSGGHLSTPSVFNIGFITKARYHTSDKKALNADGDARGSNRGNLEIFDESAFIFGGRVAENVGTSMEFGEGLLGGKFIFSKEIGDSRAGAAYFMTDALGAFSGMEIYSTGLYRPIRMFENRKGSNAAHATGVGYGAATGLQGFYSGNNLFATFGLFGPAFNGNPGLDVGSNLNNLVRLAYEVNVGVWSIAIGAYSLGGTSILSQATLKGKKAENFTEAGVTDQLISTTYASNGIDLQAEGAMGEMPVFSTINMVLAHKIDQAIGNASATTAEDESAVSVDFEIHPTQNIGIKAAYLTFADKLQDTNDKKAMSLGLDYNYAQNIKLVVEYTMTNHPNQSGDSASYSDIYLMSMIGF